MLALLDYEASQCSGCGGYLPETTDPESSYETSTPHRCYRCAALDLKKRDFKDQHLPEQYRVWPVKPKPKKATPQN